LKLLLKACGELTKNSDECSYKPSRCLAILVWVLTDQIHIAQISHKSLETSFADRMLAKFLMLECVEMMESYI